MDCLLGSEQTEELVLSLPTLDIACGAVYDALVGAAANQHGLTLVTRDRRTLRTYRTFDVEYEFVD